MTSHEETNIEIRSGDITIDEKGRVVIENPELAKAVQQRLATGRDPHINVNCGCD